MTWKCLFGWGLGLDGRGDFFFSRSVFSSNRLLGSNRESLFDKEGTMFNIKKAFFNKGQMEVSKRGDLVGKLRSNGRIVFGSVGKIFGADSDETVVVCCFVCCCLRI